jgi:hypothetical protein
LRFLGTGLGFFSSLLEAARAEEVSFLAPVEALALFAEADFIVVVFGFHFEVSSCFLVRFKINYS